MRSTQILVFFWLCLAGSLSQALPRKGSYTDPISLLEQQYGAANILAIGLPGHLNAKSWIILGEFLKKIGADPNLKTLVIERSGELDKFYQLLSTKSLADSLNQYQFKSEMAKRNALCSSPEWAYTISEFLPIIRKINVTTHPIYKVS